MVWENRNRSELRQVMEKLEETSLSPSRLGARKITVLEITLDALVDLAVQKKLFTGDEWSAALEVAMSEPAR